MTDDVTTVAELKRPMRDFAAARGWEPFHSPKNLVMALASEVGELCDLFRWLSAEESWSVAGADPELRARFADELADVANVVLLLSSHTGVDLTGAVAAKVAKNEGKYPPPSGAGSGT